MRNAIVAIFVLALAGGGVARAQAASPDPSEGEHISLRFEFLNWRLSDSPASVPLITDGLLGEPGTRVLLGGDDLDNRRLNGFRLTAGYAFDERTSLEWSLLAFKSRASSKSVESSGLLGSTDLLLPFFDVTRNGENVTEISFSPIYRGSAREEISRSLMGVEANGIRALGPGNPGRVELLGGLRWLRLRETFTFTTSSPSNPPATADIWNTTDTFDARNNFYGVQVGARAQWERGRFFADGAVKIGVGAIVQKVVVDGFLVTNDFNNFEDTERFAGGYFALPSNIGAYRRAVFAILPEAQVNAGFRIASWISAFAGYSFLYTNDVARPGNQINRNINPTQSVSWTGETPATRKGAAEPSFSFDGSSFWAHGFNVGLNLRF